MEFDISSQPILFGLVLVTWVGLHFISTKGFLFLTGMLVPLVFPRVDLGVNADWCRLLGPMALVLLLVRKRGRMGPIPGGLGWFLGYAVAVTTIWMVIEYAVLRRYVGAQAMGLGIMQSYFKMPIQLGSFLGQVLIFFVVPTRAGNRSEALAAVRGYGFGVSMSFAFGVVLYLVTGQGMFGRRGMGYVEIEGVGLWRIGGLSGEPKFLGILVAMFLLWELSGLVLGGSRRYTGFWISLAALFLTLSTSAWAGTVVGALVVLVVSMRHPKQTSWTTWTLIGSTVGALVLAGTLVGAIVSKRFSDRLFGEKSEVSRQKDAYLIEAFKEAPIHAIWGFGLGGGDLAVIPFVPPEELAYQRTPTPGVTGARLLGDLGLSGLALLLAAAWRWSKHLAARGELQGAAFAIGGLLTVFFGSLLAVSGYFLIMGAVLTAARFPRLERAKEPVRRPRLAQPVPQRA